MKKVIFVLFLIGLISLFVALNFYELENKFFYYLSILLTFLGIILYPLNTKFNSSKDFLFIPFATFCIFSLLNLFWIKSYNESLSLLNVIFGFFGFAQYFLTKQKSKILRAN